MKRKMLTLEQIFGMELLEKAIKLNHIDEFEKLTKENIQKINERTKQENNPKYLAYVLQWGLKNRGLK